MSIIKASDIILADKVTSIKYKIVIENTKVSIKEVDDSEKTSRIVISDSITRKTYNVIIENKTLNIEETATAANSTKAAIIDSITGIPYQLIITNKILMISECQINYTENVLEFVDKSQLDIITIFGGPANINGIVRDVLSIEIDPSVISIDELNEVFSNTDNLAHLYIYEPERNENGDISNTKIEIGEGYTILLGVEEVTRKVNPFPGKIVPETYESVYIVNIAQMTYDEWISSKYSPDSNE